jgi:hypothetical protein
MDYKKHYNLLMLKSKNRTDLSGYFERHHIIPRSMGGDNSDDNLTKLTGREHFLAHLLLAKMNPNHAGMTIAVLRMRGDYRRVINSKKYEWIKKSFSQRISDHHKKFASIVQNRPEVKDKHRQNTKNMWKNKEYAESVRNHNLGSKNPMYGKIVPLNVKNKTSISCGGKPFKVWKSIKIKNSSKLRISKYEKGDYVGEFVSKNEFEKVFGVWTSLIKKCLNKRTPQAMGFIFEY